MSSNFHADGTLFIVSGPSGAGKTTLINKVREQLRLLNLELYFSVSHTTRRPRSGEVEGKNYDFVIINDDLTAATECLKAAIIAKKLKNKTALEAIHKMTERFKEEQHNGRTARGH